MTRGFDLSAYGLTAPDVLRNTSLGLLYEDGLVCDGEWITSSGALATNSGDRTEPSPRDRRIVEHPDSAGDVDWGSANVKLSEKSLKVVREPAQASGRLPQHVRADLRCRRIRRLGSRAAVENSRDLRAAVPRAGHA
jgi:ATP-dependent phosphoenolpyruvate carboxykinase